MNKMMTSRLLLSLISAVLLLTGASVKNANSASDTEFHKKFADNRHLQPSDLDSLPTGMQVYLSGGMDWGVVRMSGFSRLIAKRTYLVSVSREAIGFNSRAVLIHAGRRTKISLVEKVKWERLFLPYFKKTSDGQVPYATDQHANLYWNEELNAIQSSICSDVRPVSCLRYTHKIEGSKRLLVKVEIMRSPDNKWKTLWKNGKWLTRDRPVSSN